MKAKEGQRYIKEGRTRLETVIPLKTPFPSVCAGPSPIISHHESRLISGLIPNAKIPLISENCILPVIPETPHDVPWFCGAMKYFNDPVEVIDPSNIKLIISNTGKCLYMSRAPIPFPKSSLLYRYVKYVGVECFNKKALDFFVSTPKGSIEGIEDIDHLRFLENGINLNFQLVDSDSLSVDTPKDLEKVRAMMKARLSEQPMIQMGHR